MPGKDRGASGAMRVRDQSSRIASATAQDKITIYGPKADGTYVVEFRTAAGAPICGVRASRLFCSAPGQR